MGSGPPSPSAADSSVSPRWSPARCSRGPPAPPRHALRAHRAGEDQHWLARHGISIPPRSGRLLDRRCSRWTRRASPWCASSRGLRPYTLTRAAQANLGALDAVPAGKVAQSARIAQTPLGDRRSHLRRRDEGRCGRAEGRDDDLRDLRRPRRGDAAGRKAHSASSGLGRARAAATPPPAEGKGEGGSKADAAAINARVAGLGHRLPTFVLTNLVPPLEVLVEDKPAEAPPAGDAGATPARRPAPPPAALGRLGSSVRTPRSSDGGRIGQVRIAVWSPPAQRIAAMPPSAVLGIDNSSFHYGATPSSKA